MEEGFEEKLKKANELLEGLNEPDITLEQSMKMYKDGVKVLKEASKLLEEAKLNFQELQEDDA